MATIESIELAVPNIIEGGSLLLAGLVKKHSMANNVEIPGQWQDFGSWLGRVPGQKNGVAYGVVFNSDDENSFDYLCGVEVTDFGGLPEELGRIRLAPQKYAVFTYSGHVSQIQKVCAAVWSEWLPTSPYEAADAPFFERYPETFDGRTGRGGFEIWLPITG